jgi:hypothetical protein
LVGCDDDVALLLFDVAEDTPLTVMSFSSGVQATTGSSMSALLRIACSSSNRARIFRNAS